jgi:hypothetical protein
MTSSRWTKTAALGCTLFLAFLALSTFLALYLGTASVASAQPQYTLCPDMSDPPCHPGHGQQPLLNCPSTTVGPPARYSNPCWPNTTGAPAFSESYSDIPWHQKLGTYVGNRFDEALVLPFGVLQQFEGQAVTLPNGTKATIMNVTYCKNYKLSAPDAPVGDAFPLSPERCMIETGINNIISILRTDTPYQTDDPLITAAKRCQPPATLVPVYQGGNPSNQVLSFTCSNPNSIANCPDPSVNPPNHA